ncbi:hypothetical protein, partial [Pseudoalteromonas sp. B530]
SPNNCVCNYQFGALTPIWERPSHHPLLFVPMLAKGVERRAAISKIESLMTPIIVCIYAGKVRLKSTETLKE